MAASSIHVLSIIWVFLAANSHLVLEPSPLFPIQTSVITYPCLAPQSLKALHFPANCILQYRRALDTCNRLSRENHVTSLFYTTPFHSLFISSG